MNTYREGLPQLPERMRGLPIDARGYPVPWFVHWFNGEPDFRAVDAQKFVRAIKDKRCWVCGHPLGRSLAFTIGPMCTISRVTSEPPTHYECAIYSTQACPFLSIQTAKRRERNLPEEKIDPAGIHNPRNPGVMAVWITRGFRVFKAFAGAPGHLIELEPPERVEWITQGRPATKEEALDAVRKGADVLRLQAETGGPESVAIFDDMLREAIARIGG